MEAMTPESGRRATKKVGGGLSVMFVTVRITLCHVTVRMTLCHHACVHTHTHARARTQLCHSSGRPLSARTQVQSQDSASGICGEQSDTETVCSPALGHSCQYRSTNATYPFSCPSSEPVTAAVWLAVLKRMYTGDPGCTW